MADKGNVVITIARQYGSGGRITSKRLAEELGIPFYDEEILKMTSEESAIGEQYFRLADEKAGNNLLYRIVGGVRDSLGAPTSKKLTSRENLFRFQSEVIRKLAAAKDCVIIGRCADYVLKDEKNVLSLFLYAEKKDKVRYAMETYGESYEQAVRRVRHADAARESYYHYLTKAKWGDLKNYHLTLNSSPVGKQACAEIILQYASRKNG